MRRIVRLLVLWLGWAYPVALFSVVLALRAVGEDWWVTSSALYLPRLGFGAPLLLLVPALAWLKLWRALWFQALGLVLLLFPVMGLALSWPHESAPKGSLRVLSFNVNTCHFGCDKVANAIFEHDADVVLTQETPVDDQLLPELRRRYPHVQGSTQFAIASRFPILETTNPGKLSYYGDERSPRFMRYVIASPFGKVTIFSVHPISPRQGLHELKGEGLRHEMASGRFFGGHGPFEVSKLTGLRRLQIETAMKEAAYEGNPVIVAGDTNLPGLSKVLAQNFQAYQDGFQEAGFGFGYTFPARLPWMRIDRIFASGRLRFSRFSVDCKGVSDHLCVVADLHSE